MRHGRDSRLGGWIARLRNHVEHQATDAAPTPAVGRIGHLVYIGQGLPTPMTPAERRGAEARVNRLGTWTASGDLTWGEAASLLTLDEATEWGAGAGRG